MTPEIRRANSETIARLTSSLRFCDDTTYSARGAAQKHEVAGDVSLKDVVDMLVDYRFEDPRDTESFTGILVTLGEVLHGDPDARAAVYQMRPKAAGVRRTVSADGTLENGFQQGRTALADGGTAYPGDAFFRADDRLSIQLHQYDLTLEDGAIGAHAASLLAIHIPSELAKDWLVQLQSGQR